MYWLNSNLTHFVLWIESGWLRSGWISSPNYWVLFALSDGIKVYIVYTLLSMMLYLLCTLWYIHINTCSYIDSLGTWIPSGFQNLHLRTSTTQISLLVGLFGLGQNQFAPLRIISSSSSLSDFNGEFGYYFFRQRWSFWVNWGIPIWWNWLDTVVKMNIGFLFMNTWLGGTWRIIFLKVSQVPSLLLVTVLNIMLSPTDYTPMLVLHKTGLRSTSCTKDPPGEPPEWWALLRMGHVPDFFFS